MNRDMQGRRQEGTVLILALVFVLMLALLAGMVMRTGVLQIRMAGNDQFQEEARQLAYAITAVLPMHPDNFSLDVEMGHTACAPGSESPDCDSTDLQGPGEALVIDSYEVDYRVTRLDPLLWQAELVAGSADDENGGPAEDIAVFEVDVRVDGGANRLGSAHVIQGMVVVPPVAPGKLYRSYWREPGVDPL